MFRVSGILFKTADPLQFDVQEILMVLDGLEQGFVLEVNCNYPEAFLPGDVIANKWEIIYEKTRPIVGHLNGYFSYTGSGNLTFTNHYSEFTNDK